jgi:outer membrane protein
MLIIRRLATSQGYDLVVDKAAVPYSRSDLDLTDRVITMYNGGTLPTDDAAEKPAAGKPAAEKKPAAPKPAQK